MMMMTTMTMPLQQQNRERRFGVHYVTFTRV
jgi:hypothetical protein